MTRGALPGRVLYDDPVFFAGYQHLRATGAGLNEELEQPALARMLAPVPGLDEPSPGDEAVARHPDLAQHRRRPPLLLLAAVKPD